MSTNNQVIFLLIIQASIVLSALPQIRKCQLQNSNCLKASAQPVVPIVVAGNPELGSESLDPLLVNLTKVDLSGLRLTVSDAVTKGLRKSVIDKLSVDIHKKQMQLIYHSDLTLDGKYKASGKLLILPISGDGDIYIALKNCQIIMDMLFDITKNKDGKDIIDLQSYKYKYNVKDNASFRFTNLFNGNKVLGDTMLGFMNSNWKALTLEFGQPMFNKPIKKVFNAIKAYLKSLPLEEIVIA